MYAQKMQPNKDGKVGEGVHFERIRRITGYLVGTLDRFNNGKKAECLDRVKHLKVQPKSCKRYKIKIYSPLKIGGLFCPYLVPKFAQNGLYISVPRIIVKSCNEIISGLLTAIYSPIYPSVNIYRTTLYQAF